MKKYLIIGGSSGIGKELCSMLSKSGNYIFATYNTNRIENDEDNIKYYHLNVLDKELDLGFLPDSLNGLVYCPGSINLRPFDRIKSSEFTKDFELLVEGAIKIIQIALPNLKKSDSSSVVLFSTVAVQKGFKYHTQVSASKGALEGLTKALASELAPKIRVNCIAPSITDTPLTSKILVNDEKKEASSQRHPLKRIGKASDIANMADFLLSDKSSWITGQIFHVDGGISTVNL